MALDTVGFTTVAAILSEFFKCLSEAFDRNVILPVLHPPKQQVTNVHTAKQQCHEQDDCEARDVSGKMGLIKLW